MIRRQMSFRAIGLAALFLVASMSAVSGQIEQLSNHVELSEVLDASERSGVVVGRALDVASAPGTEIIIFDDGEPDNGFGPSTGAFFEGAMLVELPRPGMTVDELTICVQRLGTDDSLDFDIAFWAANGPGGTPGSLLNVVPATVSGVPMGIGGGFFTFDLSGQNVVLPGTQTYWGARWDGAIEDAFFVCADRDGAQVQPGFVDINQSGTWTDLTTEDPDYTSLMIRGQASDDFVPGPCVPGVNTLCLNGGRFQVDIDFAAAGQPLAPGRAIDIGLDDGGLFWFFNNQNPEMLVKVLDACNLQGFNSFWVFYAATTDVEFEMTVTDTQAGVSKTYGNDLGVAAPPIQDTAAFATCP